MSYSDNYFVSMYNRQIDMIYRLCFSYLKNKEDTEDAVQSVFVKYLKIGKKFENEHHEKAWFIVTSSNICKDMLRQSWRHNIALRPMTLFQIQKILLIMKSIWQFWLFRISIKQ